MRHDDLCTHKTHWTLQSIKTPTLTRLILRVCEASPMGSGDFRRISYSAIAWCNPMTLKIFLAWASPTFPSPFPIYLGNVSLTEVRVFPRQWPTAMGSIAMGPISMGPVSMGSFGIGIIAIANRTTAESVNKTWQSMCHYRWHEKHFLASISFLSFFRAFFS